MRKKCRYNAKQTAELIEKYGKAAAVALSARRVSTADVAACFGEGAYAF